MSLSMLRSPLVRAILVHAVAAAFVASAALAQGKIAWETDFQKALERAKAEGKPLVACISMEGERVCDVTIAEHYTDSSIVKLSKRTVNLFCSPHGTPAQQEMEKRVRIDLLGGDATTLMVAPQHVFLKPDGTVIHTVPYYIAPGELEWLWVAALRECDPEFVHEPSERMRAPARLKKKTETVKEIKPPPTKKELAAILKEIKKGFGGYWGAREKLPVIVRHPSRDAQKFVDRILRSIETGDRERIEALGIIGANAPRSWWKVAADQLGHETPTVRIAAARALGSLGEKKAIGAMNGRWRKEDSMQVKGELLRAIVRCGPNHKTAVKLVPLVLDQYDDEAIRVQATLAVGGLAKRDVVVECLTAALADASPKVRSTAAYVIATRRETGVADALAKTTEGEGDEDARAWMVHAGKVLDGGEADAFEVFLDEVVGVRR